ncbi:MULTISPECIES: HpcH/HpaI aldolase/citrate lyase family protein [Candidatus Nitrosocaldus]|jgi:citrate lyase subunit beta/citryl-CoA lyase|uniref:Putative citrate/ citryl-CoA lyase n=1 Tax=Candidatus Nitrosocaldus cavascurensis TaxID=2058097 RepID=A0A2K5ANN9_9ARCH|nr:MULTISPECIES: CoA ester lyase [Candidatus Nitrosocaldus]SPC33253.1 putative citrate/ citryl-CoA lyase [Candidatus Nitrosocaldus cavascurensis]
MTIAGRLIRTLLFVPGNNPRFIEKAKTLRADIICLDLEDSVPMDEKDRARTMVRDAIKARKDYASELYIRVNSPDSGLIKDDLKVVDEGLDGIVIPKVNEAREVTKVAEVLDELEKKYGIGKNIEIMPSIESARGVVNAYSIASSSDRVSALIFGVFDFMHDMGLEYAEDAIGFNYARAKIPVDARAAGVYAIDGIWQAVDDVDGLIRDAMLGMRLGYKGKSIIHPRQIEPVHKVFVPSKDEIEWARKVVVALEEAMKQGRGAVRLEGRMVDAVHYKRAKALLEAIGSSTD